MKRRKKCIDVNDVELRSMEGSGGAVCKDDGDEFEGAGIGRFRYADEYG
jgi:hypothetical protein